jgi:hypothetical protein
LSATILFVVAIMLNEISRLSAFSLSLTLALASHAQEPSQQPAPQQPSSPQITLGLRPTKSATPAPAAPTTTENPATPAAPPPSGNRLLNYRVSVGGSQQWTDTKIDLVPGDKVQFSSSGKVQFMARDCTPDGLTRGWADLIRSLPVNNAGNCTLIGRIGEADTAVPFAIGSKKELDIRRGGRLYLGVNQTSGDTSDGQYNVTVEIVPAAQNLLSTTPAPVTTATAQPFDTAIFEKIPRRVVDMQGNKGDAVNFLIIGSKDQLEAAFAQAGWVIADRSIKDAVLNATMKSTSKQVYLEMPMSQLYMFNRTQDYGYARTEPVQVVASRHHLRIWKSPFEVDGQPVWVGACTHDIGFERDQRNNGVTHKIDPEIDKERDYLAGTLNASGLVSNSTYVTPPEPITEAHTATGGTFRSDGRILVVRLAAQ